LGWAEITHPFHPLRGQRFLVLRRRRISGVETVSLRGNSDETICVPREWTDLSDVSPLFGLGAASLVLEFGHLLVLAQLVDEIAPSRQKKKGKGD
jgi:hypothetical protein